MKTQKKVALSTVFFVILFVFGGVSLSFAQKEGEKKEDAPTKLERFLLKKGTLIIKETYKAGKLSGKRSSQVTVTAMVIYEPGETQQPKIL